MKRAIHIMWDTNGDEELAVSLPYTIDIPNEIYECGEDIVSDYISEQTGFCHSGYEMDDGE